MALDIVNLLNQTKWFMETERDTFLGLVAIVFLELLALKFVTDFVPLLQEYATEILLVVLLITLIYWSFGRIIRTSKEKFSIGLSFIDLLSLDVKEMITCYCLNFT